MAPTEYRAIAKRAELRPLPDLRHAVAAGEPLNPEVVRPGRRARASSMHDGYGQTETGALTGMPIGAAGAARVDGHAPARVPPLGRRGRAVRWTPATVPTFFLDGARDRPWRTGDRVTPGRGRLPLVRGPHRRRDHLRRLPDRAVRGGVGARVAPRGGGGRRRCRAGRGARAGGPRRGGAARRATSRGDALARELQEHVKSETAPYKYPRIVEFVDSLPKTASGKIKRAELRG